MYFLLFLTQQEKNDRRKGEEEMAAEESSLRAVRRARMMTEGWQWLLDFHDVQTSDDRGRTQTYNNKLVSC